MKKLLIPFIIFFALHVITLRPMPAQQDNLGLFLPSHYYLTDSNPDGVAIGDVNNDGRNDIVVANDYDNGANNDYKLLVYLQTNEGKLADPVIYDTNSVSFGIIKRVEIADVNSDNLNDVIINARGGVGVYYQNGGQTLDALVVYNTTYMTTANAHAIAVGDVNNDGRTDVVAATAGGGVGYLEVFLQDPNPPNALILDNTYALSAFPTDGDIEIGDMNLSVDDLDDVVIMQPSGTNEIAILHQNAGGGLNAPVEYDLGVYPDLVWENEMAVGDVNGDGRPDVIVTHGGNTPDSYVGILHQNAGGTLNAMITYEAYDCSDAVVVGDVNRDGLMDIIIEHSGWGQVGVFYQQIDGTMSAEEDLYNSSVAQHSKSLAYGDVNGDGWNDVVLAADPWVGIAIKYGWDGSDAIVVMDPVGGETMNVNVSYTVRWQYVGDLQDVQIAYSLNGGGTWTISTYSMPISIGYHNWSVPWTPSDNCYIRIADVDGSPVGVSRGPFSIVDDGVDRIRITSPGSGEAIAALSTYQITWETTGSTVGGVQIEYTIDGGTTWESITGTTHNDGSYDWDVPDVTSSQCKIRISPDIGGDPSDTSDGSFQIIGAGADLLNLTFPNGGETLPGGQTQTITWTSSGSISNVKIEYSTDNGTSWTVITSSTGNDGSHSWKVPSIESNECLVRISDALDSDPSDQSASTFSIVYAGPEILKVSKPNGNNFYLIGTTDYITWTSTGRIDNVRIEYSTDNGASWTEIKGSTPNNGSYEWEVPDTPSTQCLVRITDAADGTPTDTSNSVFTIMYPQPGISISSPVGGENWEVGKQHDITWITSGTVGNVKIEYSSNNKNTWNTITISTANDGSYTWTIPNAESSDCYVRISEAADGDPTSTNINPFSIITGPEDAEITINRTALYFASMKMSDAKTPNQKIIVDNNSDVATLRWGAEVDEEATWLRIDTTSGLNSGMITVSVQPLWMDVGTHTGTITISADDANNSPQTVNVTLTVYPSLSDSAPFGSFETPQDGSTVMSSIPVTGWVLDDIGVDKVSIYRSAVPAEGDGMVYVGDAVLVDGARPDVEQLYPTYPASYKAGWGYMMLTNFLPNGGNGTFTLYAYAKDETDHEVLLGSKTITCDNANAEKPFGAIDTPEQGGEANGSSYRNNGWVLTPMPNKIPENGSTIFVYIDGVSLGNVNYGYYREDIASLFPGYANSNGAHGYLDIDTTAYSNGLHTIQWTATDNAGNADGIGSRYFVTIQNPGYNRTASVSTTKKRFRSLSQLVKVPVNRTKAVGLRTGYRKGVKPRRADVDKNGIVQVKLKQDNRLELHLFQGKGPGGYRNCEGYMVVGEQLRMLPPGSTLDRKKGILYWHAAAGFFGKYELMFVLEDASGKITKKPVKVTIVPKY